MPQQQVSPWSLQTRDTIHQYVYKASPDNFIRLLEHSRDVLYVELLEFVNDNRRALLEVRGKCHDGTATVRYVFVRETLSLSLKQRLMRALRELLPEGSGRHYATRKAIAVRLDTVPYI